MQEGLWRENKSWQNLHKQRNKEKPVKGSLKQLTLPQYANKGAYKTTKREKENNKHTHISKATALLLLYRLFLKDISGRSFYCIWENFHCIAGETIRQKRYSFTFLFFPLLNLQSINKLTDVFIKLLFVNQSRVIRE